MIRLNNILLPGKSILRNALFVKNYFDTVIKGKKIPNETEKPGIFLTKLRFYDKLQPCVAKYA